MEIILNHPNLNLFNHFGDSAQNENNTTRAFLIAATRSCWNLVLLRGFFDLVALRVRERHPDRVALLGSFFQTHPDEIKISMEKDINADDFPGTGVDRAILVELTPVGNVPDPQSSPVEVGDTGRVDATIVVRTSESDSLALVIESKLYGRAGQDQLETYKQALEKRGVETLLVYVAWEEVYALADGLPEAAEHDAILSDFKSFLARNPRLVGFTGFKQDDFDGPAYILDARLQKLCETLVGQNDRRALQGAKVERKRGGLDYDILLEDQSRLVGNIGLACWGQNALCAKLVIGWRSRWDTNRVIEFNPDDDGVNEKLQSLVAQGGVTIEATVRPFFNRFKYPRAARWSRDVERNGNLVDVWATVIEFARNYHAQPLNREGLEHLQQPPEQCYVAILDQDALNRALDTQVKCFVPVDLVTEWRPEYLVGLTPDELKQEVGRKLEDLAGLLRLLSGFGPEVGPGEG